ncbi:MAG: heavy metal translocating P-type ATPase [Acholeplasmataceae bacterium]|nr:heavy metal translocating P-type ATPase [Acholeplasmataceae bacterium]
MQRWILRRKNEIALVSFIFIVIGFFGHWVLQNELVAMIAFIIPSVIGTIPIAIQAYQALRVRVISIDLLVTIAVIGAFVIKNYEESAIVTFLFLFGTYLEQRTLTKTRSAIKELTELAPEMAVKKMPDGSFLEMSVDEVDIGDILLVRTGAKIPVDGKVIFGEGVVNEATITGESMPIIKGLDASLFAGTILENGTLHMVAEKIGEDTTFGKIIELVEEAQDSKSQAERFIDRFAKYYTPFVLLLGVAVGLIWQDVELAVTILVLGCPGALVIGVPVANVAGIGNGARHGVLLKGSEVIHDFSRIDTIIFDKTGTLTLGEPQVAGVKNYQENQTDALAYLASIERESEHPLAKAILAYIGETEPFSVKDTDVIKGAGIIAKVDGRRIAVGNENLMEKEGIILTESVIADVDDFTNKGYSLVLTAIDGVLYHLLGIRDEIRENVKEDLIRIRKLGVKHLVVLSGDHQKTVDIIADELGLTEAYGHLLPEDKAAFIQNLQEQGKKIAFVGDGVNDSPSLARAQVGIAMGGGTDVAIETSDLVLMNSDFSKLPHALGLTKATVRNMRQNIWIAIGVVFILLMSLLFSDWMNMSIGMLAHEASILVVILNGMRLLKYSYKK